MYMLYCWYDKKLYIILNNRDFLRSVDLLNLKVMYFKIYIYIDIIVWIFVNVFIYLLNYKYSIEK